jgi:signal transduction histidine kinase/CheY-like chemotaxis protein
MVEGAGSDAAGATTRLQRCIRDLAALDALPALCLGRMPDEALEIVMDALPTALGCDLVLISLPKAMSKTRARCFGNEVTGEALLALESALEPPPDPAEPITLPDARKVWCWQVELPVGTARGRLVVGHRRPLDPETDRVLIRSAANLVGTTLESAKVLEAAHRKDEFLAMLGHELRNPLAPIMTAVELLARHPVAAREQKIIHRQVRHLARLVDDLLDISRVTRGHIELKKEAVSLEAVIERAVELATPLITRYQHTLQVDSAQGLTLSGDLVRLAQVVGNLLTNAAKFTPPQGEIKVLVAAMPGRVRITVSDNGRGIPAPYLGRIFEPFVQAHGARDAARGGLGLGLAIVKNLVLQHGGSITVDSKGEGQGSSFSIELPTLTQPQQVAPPLPAPREHSERAGLRVLVVDDNVDVAQLLSEALELEGYQTATANDASAALETWRRFGPQAGVLDLGMPDVDGYELAQRLRAEHGSRPVLIAATGYGQPDDRLRTAAAGFDCHLIKPVSLEELVRTLDRRLVATRLEP